MSIIKLIAHQNIPAHTYYKCNNHIMKIIISGGGTAGHIYPAIAVADKLMEYDNEILFVGAKGKMEMMRVPKAGYSIIGLPISGIKRSFALSNLLVPFKTIYSLFKAMRIIKKFQPDVVAGFGGYASAPTLIAAQILGIPTVIQEQNSYAGLTNRILGKRAKKICVAYNGMDRFFRPEKIIETGNPLKTNIENTISINKTEAYNSFGLDPDKKTILVTGGSLGTRTLNQMIVESLSIIPSDVQVIWQTGSFYEKQLSSAVVESNIIKTAFIEQMDLAYAVADLIICRAGASTISEIELLGKPAIFVPSPNVAEDHQTKNAMELVKNGAALMVPDHKAIKELMPAALELLQDNELLNRMSMRVHDMAKPNATNDVANIIMTQARQ